MSATGEPDGTCTTASVSLPRAIFMSPILRLLNIIRLAGAKRTPPVRRQETEHNPRPAFEKRI